MHHVWEVLQDVEMSGEHLATVCDLLPTHHNLSLSPLLLKTLGCAVVDSDELGEVKRHDGVEHVGAVLEMELLLDCR